MKDPLQAYGYPHSHPDPLPQAADSSIKVETCLEGEIEAGAQRGVTPQADSDFGASWVWQDNTAERVGGPK